MSLKKRKPKVKKLGKGLSSLLVKDEELASIVKRQGRPKKIEPGEYKKNRETVKEDKDLNVMIRND